MAIAWIDEHLDVKSEDPDDRRRGRLLNILLLGFLIISGFLLLLEVVLLIFGQDIDDMNTDA